VSSSTTLGNFRKSLKKLVLNTNSKALSMKTHPKTPVRFCWVVRYHGFGQK